MVFPGAPRTPSNWAVGCAQEPMQEMFWLPYRSSWLAPHHHVATTGGGDAEHRAVGQPPLGPVVADQRGLAVAEHQVGSEGAAGQLGAQPGDQSDPAGQDLAIAPPRLGAGDDADLDAAGPGHDTAR